MPLNLRPDVLIVGGSLGGVAAAIAAARRGAMVALVAQGDWLGGQLTAQGVCTPDENAWIEDGGASASYRALRKALRDHYRRHYRLSAQGLAQEYFNPGSCWVSRISAEPRVALRVLSDMLGTYGGRVRTLFNCHAVEVVVAADRITSVRFRAPNGDVTDISAPMVLDATDLGDLLPLAGAEYRLGAEGRDETGEPDAPERPALQRIQPFTFPFALELRPAGEDHTIPRPANYDRMKALQQYHVLDGAMQSMFGEFGWWDYRRVIAAANFDDPAFPCDIAMINTSSNDYRGGVLPAGSPEAQRAVLADGRLASLGYVYWLQTECPREDDPSRHGYPELLLCSDWFGTADGLAPEPYIRESRRIVALDTVREQDIVVADASGQVHQSGPRARFRPDSVGIGHYWLDIHEGASDEPGVFLDTVPYQIPMGALIPVRLRNLLPACKNLGVTHLTNGALRLHPVEWAVGEASGALAAFCVEHAVEPHDVFTRASLRERFQDSLLDAGVPLYWWGDLAPDRPEWQAAQWLSIKGIWPKENDIRFRSDEPVPADFPLHRPACPTRDTLAMRLFAEMHRG